jgi:hypothetical protein
LRVNKLNERRGDSLVLHALRNPSQKFLDLPLRVIVLPIGGVCAHRAGPRLFGRLPERTPPQPGVPFSPDEGEAVDQACRHAGKGEGAKDCDQQPLQRGFWRRGVGSQTRVRCDGGHAEICVGLPNRVTRVGDRGVRGRRRR